MRYNVAQLLKGPAGAQRQYELDEDIGNLDEALEPVQSLAGSVVLMRTSQGVLVTGKLRTMLKATCRRCLELCDMEVELDIEEEFYPSLPISGFQIDRIEDEDYDDALLIDEHHILDLREVIRQALWLAAPEDALCRIDCAGLCPRCGGNRNLGECQCAQPEIDPRWATLQALLPDESDL
jgi:uncharacterized protein